MSLLQSVAADTEFAKQPLWFSCTWQLETPTFLPLETVGRYICSFHSFHRDFSCLLLSLVFTWHALLLKLKWRLFAVQTQEKVKVKFPSSLFKVVITFNCWVNSNKSLAKCELCLKLSHNPKQEVYTKMSIWISLNIHIQISHIAANNTLPLKLTLY
jgi:hypothetical protein